MRLPTGKLTHFSNPTANKANVYSTEQQAIVGLNKAQEAINTIKRWPGYEPTVLHNLAPLASKMNVANVWYKNESTRFGLKSFKALGGAYAVARQLQKILHERSGTKPSMDSLHSSQYADQVKDIVVSCATDGNHGRSVAWGAALFGCQCIIYVHKDVSEGRIKAIESYGAQVIQVDGNYDDSVRSADSDAKQYGRIIISDTSYEGYMDIPKDVALGYTVMLEEIISQLQGDIPTHVFIQGGVGAVASSVVGYFWDYWSEKRPRFIIVEPEKANCLQQSAQAGRLITVKGDLETMMAGLACGEVSELAWRILHNGVDDFITLSEDAIAPAMRLLGNLKPEPIEAGESAVPGFAAAIVASQNSTYRPALGLNSDSNILVLGTEGASDPDLYTQIMKEGNLR